MRSSPRVPCLVVATGLVLTMAAPASAEPAWREVLAGMSALERAGADLRGELLWFGRIDDDATMRVFDVHRTDGTLVLRNPAGYTLGMGRQGGLADHDEGWFVPLPMPGVSSANKAADLDALEHKYRVRLLGDSTVAGRPCARLELRRRADQVVRELLCIDHELGLVSRRESFAPDGRIERLVAYLRLEAGAPSTAPAPDKLPLQRRDMGSVPVRSDGVAALRRAGWHVPAELPAGYRLAGTYAMTPEGSQPALQAVYRDGLYTVSVYQQRGRPDWTALPQGARRADDLPWPAYQWPGAMPRRLVWEAGGVAYSLLGDPPEEEFLTIAAALPHDAPPGITTRLRRGLRRLWSWVSPWE